MASSIKRSALEQPGDIRRRNLSQHSTPAVFVRAFELWIETVEESDSRRGGPLAALDSTFLRSGQGNNVFMAACIPAPATSLQGQREDTWKRRQPYTCLEFKRLVDAWRLQ